MINKQSFCKICNSLIDYTKMLDELPDIIDIGYKNGALFKIIDDTIDALTEDMNDKLELIESFLCELPDTSHIEVTFIFRSVQQLEYDFQEVTSGSKFPIYTLENLYDAISFYNKSVNRKDFVEARIQFVDEDPVSHTLTIENVIPKTLEVIL